MYELSEDEEIDIITSSDTDEEEKREKEGLANINERVVRDSSSMRTQISSESTGKYNFSKNCTFCDILMSSSTGDHFNF